MHLRYLNNAKDLHTIDLQIHEVILFLYFHTIEISLNDN